MKIINRYLAFIAVMAMLFTSCSKDETSSIADDPSNTNFVDLTFGAVLNDLSNRASMEAAVKSHFDDIPECSGADPAYVILEISYDGQAPETEGPITIDILSDDSGYFTDYSELLKIPVPDGGTVNVSLDSFKVYDADDNLIWLAPVESEAGEFDGYVDQALSHVFPVQDGTKPYIDVEVLCFDDRMLNEYGYVFFDILPEVIYPFCLFVNYCDEDGRHYVGDYSVDLYFGQDDTGIQLYDHTEESAMAMTGDYGEGAYYADPLCLVVPGPPANLPDDEPYLYLVLHPNDWVDNYGDIDNSPIAVQLTWEMVGGLLNDDGETNEYWHALIGECEGALTGDGSGGNGGNGGGECNPSSAEADCDDDGTPNRCDPDNANYAGFDCDGDGTPNGQENEGCVDDPDPECGESTECQADIDEDGICDDVDTDIPCNTVSTADNATIDVSAQGPPPPSVLLGELGDAVVVITSTTNSDLYIVEFILDETFTSTDNIEYYSLSLTQGDSSLEMEGDVDTDNVELEVNLSDFDTSSAINIDASIIYCEQ